MGRNKLVPRGGTGYASPWLMVCPIPIVFDPHFTHHAQSCTEDTGSLCKAHSLPKKFHYILLSKLAWLYPRTQQLPAPLIEKQTTIITVSIVTLLWCLPLSLSYYTAGHTARCMTQRGRQHTPGQFLPSGNLILNRRSI